MKKQDYFVFKNSSGSIKNVKRTLTYISVALVGLFCLALIALQAYHNQFLLNPDGVSYISIAQQYAHGHFTTAVNAYWSPMLSWLMAIPLWVGLNGQQAFLLVNVISAFSCLLLSSLFVWKYSKKGLMATCLYAVTLLPFLAYSAASVITPDTLVILWVICLMWGIVGVEKILRNESRYADWRAAALLAVIGIFGFFIKLFLLPFFLLSLVVWYLIRVASNHKNVREAFLSIKKFDTLKLPIFTALLFIILMAPWVTALSMKYGKIMIGSAFAYTTAANDPNYPGQPETYQLLPPPNTNAYDAWEDPTVLPYEHYTPTSNVGGIKHFIKTRFENLPLLLDRINELSPFMIGAFLTVLLVLCLKRSAYKDKLSVLIPMILFLCYSFGYFLVLKANARYLWPLFVLLLSAGVIPAGSIFGKLKGLRKGFIVVILLLVPFVEWLNYGPRLTLTGPVNENFLHAQSVRMKSAAAIPSGSTIAANSFHFSNGFAYYLDTKSEGTINPKAKEDYSQIHSQLRKHNVQYFISVESESVGQYYATFGHVTYKKEISARYCTPTSSGQCEIQVVKLY